MHAGPNALFAAQAAKHKPAYILVCAHAFLLEQVCVTPHQAVMLRPLLAEVPVLLLQTSADLLEAVYCLVGLQRVTQSTSFDQVRVKQLALPWIRAVAGLICCNG